MNTDVPTVMLGDHPSLLRRAVRILVLAVGVIVFFTIALAILVIAKTD